MDLTGPAKSLTNPLIVRHRYEDLVTKMHIKVLGTTRKSGTNINIHHGNIDQFNSGTSKEYNTV